MITKKLWILNKRDTTQADAVFLFGLGCDVEVKVPEPAYFDTVNGTRVQYCAEWPTIKITTTCKKQESMLYLKYGDQLVLQQVYHSVPRTTTPHPKFYETCNLVPHSRQAT
jgi:hypothetical protein